MIFKCVEDFVAPEEIVKAGQEGRLQVKSCIGWLDLSSEEFTHVRNSCIYRIKEEK